MAKRPGQGGYDLHTHSIFSDGTTSPTEVVDRAVEVGLQGISLTDHDTTDGWAEARTRAEAVGIDFLPGIEITTRDGWRSTHLLAYGLDPLYRPLARELDEVRSARVIRAREMVRRLNKDFAITWKQVLGSDDARTVGRPHIADALVAAGFFPDRSAAFAGVLRPGSPYYLGTHALDTVQAIGLVRSAGGVAVLAHPAASRHSGPVEREALERFTEAGLWGIELEHPENRLEWIEPLRQDADALGLTVTGASDYHGAGKPNRLGERVTPAEVVERIRAQVTTAR